VAAAEVLVPDVLDLEPGTSPRRGWVAPVAGSGGPTRPPCTGTWSRVPRRDRGRDRGRARPRRRPPRRCRTRRSPPPPAPRSSGPSVPSSPVSSCGAGAIVRGCERIVPGGGSRAIATDAYSWRPEWSVASGTASARLPLHRSMRRGDGAEGNGRTPPAPTRRHGSADGAAGARFSSCGRRRDARTPSPKGAGRRSRTASPFRPSTCGGISRYPGT
jgi:hypothetical protein